MGRDIKKPYLALEPFDLGHLQGLAFLSDELSHAVNFGIGEDFNPEEMCRQLRGLANWIEWNIKPK